MLINRTLYGTEDKVREAVDILKQYEPPEGYYLCFSGGKDSLCCYYLCLLAGVKFDAHYNYTTVDPPELVKFIMTFDDVEKHHPGVQNTMWNMIIRKKMPPTRIMRYCCSTLKEGGGKGRIKILGVREEESLRRKGRDVVMIGDKKNPLGDVINIIYRWTEDDVWEFIQCWLNADYCELYDKGYSRLGCIGCPMGGHRGMKREFERYPAYRRAYVRTFEKMINEREKDGMDCTGWRTGEDVLYWWMYGKKREDEMQCKLWEENADGTNANVRN